MLGTMMTVFVTDILERQLERQFYTPDNIRTLIGVIEIMKCKWGRKSITVHCQTPNYHQMITTVL